MALKQQKTQKLYYSISEVAKMFELNESALRFWEKEFTNINPRKNDKGTRFYKEEDIEAVREVHFLLKEQGLTLAGAKKRLKDNKEEVVRQVEVIRKLKQIRSELLHLKEAFDRLDPEE